MTVEPMTSERRTDPAFHGFLYALSAYLIWGLQPFYMKALGHIPAAEFVAHRVLWSLPIAGAVLVWLGRTADIRIALRSPRLLAMGTLTAALIAVNSGIYVWAIAADRALEAALGYYINPLFSIFLAAVVLREKLSRAQIVAILLATGAVAILTWETGGLPWVSIGLAVTWGLYALFKKTLPIGPAQGFFLEMLLLATPALGYVIWLETTGAGHFVGTGGSDTWLLVGCGLITATPLILYANGAKLLRLSTIGIMQYIAPTIVFFIAVFVFREPFGYERAVAFGLIWLALLIYTWPMLTTIKKER